MKKWLPYIIGGLVTMVIMSVIACSGKHDSTRVDTKKTTETKDGVVLEQNQDTGDIAITVQTPEDSATPSTSDSTTTQTGTAAEPDSEAQTSSPVIRDIHISLRNLKLNGMQLDSGNAI